MERQKKTDSGITLVALVVSIIVMLVLAGVSLNATVGDNGIISKARLATIMNKFAGYKEQLELNAVEDEGVYASGQTIKNYIPDMEDLDIEKFVIMKRQLMYLENDELEIEACKNVGIQTADTGEEGSSSAISEVKSVISGVVDLASNEGDAFRVPEDDFDVTTDTNDTSEGLVGIRLYDRNSLNLINKTWNIVIEYNNSNQETARYGSGYYWLKKGETYTINGEAKTFENDFIVDYANKQYTVLSGRAVNWNDSSTIAVSTGLVLNIDPVSLADGEWKQNTTDRNYYDFYVKDTRTGRETNTGIQKTGDVEYDSGTKALKLNEDTTNNPYGEDGLLRLNKTGLDFSNGFTFEYYGKLSRLAYNNGQYCETNNKFLGLFCRDNQLFQNVSSPWQVMRFGLDSKNVIWADFCDYDGVGVWTGDGMNIGTYTDSNITGNSKSPTFIELNKDFYMTVVYTVYDSSVQNDEYTDLMREKGNLDKVSLYLNGQLYGYTYYSKIGFEYGRNRWNNDNIPFLIGCMKAYKIGDVRFLKGLCYTTRLYTISMTPTQVKDNYDTTLKYRSSF